MENKYLYYNRNKICSESLGFSYSKMTLTFSQKGENCKNNLEKLPEIFIENISRELKFNIEQ